MHLAEEFTNSIKKFTNFAWDGKVLLHQWKTFTTQDALTDQIITWVFEEDSYIDKFGNEWTKVLQELRDSHMNGMYS
jgi:hypothetical protein